MHRVTHSTPPPPPSLAAAAPQLHTFKLGPRTLENCTSYKYLGVHFKSSGNPADYMPPARGAITAAYRLLWERYTSLGCGGSLALQLRFFRRLRHVFSPLWRRTLGRASSHAAGS